MIEAIAYEPEPEAEPLQGHGELILIVEDDLAVQQATHSLLIGHAYQAVMANNGVEAIALVSKRSAEIGLVLMDMMIPNMDGIKTIRALRKMNPQVPIIAVSGLSSYREPALEAGANLFLAKPYTIEGLLRNMAELLNDRSS
jgi:hypothetical protein